jgi:creatinine amidohydrolase
MEDNSMGYSIFDGTMVDLTWEKVDELVKENAIVLLPTGVIEAHGPHMCLGVDTYGSYIKCKLIKELVETKESKHLLRLHIIGE